MSTLKPLKVGIIGAGGIGRHYHIPSYLRSGNVQIVAACDINDEALEQIRAEHGVNQLVHDYLQLLESDIDIVSVCTSNDMHHPVVMAAIEKGLDIYCEKPLALTLSEAREMYEAARDKGIKTGVNFSHRRTPAAQLAKEIISSGALGNIHYVSAVYAAGAPSYAKGPGTWRNDRARAGFGGLGDMGSHMIDMMLWWLGTDITAVAAQLSTVIKERVSRDTGKPMPVTTEDHGNFLVQYANGALGYFCGSYMFTGRGYDQRVEVYGTEGGLMYNQQRPYELDVFLPPEALKQYVVIRHGGTPDTPYTTIHVPERLHGIVPGTLGQRRTVLMDYVDAYRADGPFQFSPNFYDGMQVQQVLEACQISQDTRRWVDLPL